MQALWDKSGSLANAGPFTPLGFHAAGEPPKSTIPIPWWNGRRQPLGLTEALPEGKQLTGNSGSAGPTVTAGGLVFVGATTDRRLRAFDSKPAKNFG